MNLLDPARLDPPEEPVRPRVLLIEDDVDLRFSVRLSLEAVGWAVVEASTAATGVVSAQRDDPDVIVLDLGLPDGDGREVLARLKSRAETAWVPIVVLSGRAEASLVAALLRAGAEDYVVKPFSTDELEARLIAARRVSLEHRRLASSEANYRAAFEEAPVGMAQVDRGGRLLKVNEALSHMLGYGRDDLEGRPLLDLIHPDDAVGAGAAGQSIATDQAEGFRAERRFVNARGNHIWVEVTASVITDGGGDVSHFLGHYVDISDRKRFEDQLHHLVVHDLLSGLLNSRGFEAELDRQVALVARYGASGALMVLDLDHFKQVNDTLGHKAGDEIIVSMADTLRLSVRKTDVVARLGGDEFAIILPHANAEQAEAVAGKIVAAVRNKVTLLSGAHNRQVTTSIGCQPVAAQDC